VAFFNTNQNKYTEKLRTKSVIKKKKYQLSSFPKNPSQALTQTDVSGSGSLWL